jgi:hypothetical protein
VIERFRVSKPLAKLGLSLGYRATVAIPVLLLFSSHVSAQSPAPPAPAPQQDPPSSNATLQSPPSQPAPASSPQAPETSPSPSVSSSEDTGGQQTKRILGIVPNFQAVSANTQLPPLTVRQKFWLATEGSFDYSSFISVGIQAAVEEATNTYPEFHEGAAGYGRYYWHTFADATVENYFTGAMFPAITREDPRYYTLYHGSVPRRVIYAFSRLWKTKNDSGSPRVNVSEILGSGVATVVSSRYYPAEDRNGSREILERWGSQLLNDGVGNVFQEFWPDIHQKFFTKH